MHWGTKFKHCEEKNSIFFVLLFSRFALSLRKTQDQKRRVCSESSEYAEVCLSTCILKLGIERTVCATVMMMI